MASYLYNGVELPKIPSDFNPKNFPYLLISRRKDGITYDLIIRDKPMLYQLRNNALLWYGRGYYRRYIFSSQNSTWVLNTGLVESGNDDGDNGTVGMKPFYPIWTNFDLTLFDTNGEIYLQKSNPISVDHSERGLSLDLLNVYKIGAHIRDTLMERGKSSSVLYSYNQQLLNQIPERDEKRYPYAFIYYGTSNLWCVIFSSKKMVYGMYKSSDGSTDVRAHIISSNDETFAWILYRYEYNSWVLYNEKEQATKLSVTSPITWSNFDIKNVDDNTIYLSASKPIFAG